MKIFSLIFLLLFFIGCSNKHPYLPTVKEVQLEKYTGTWFEIARFEHFFEKGCKNVTATYQIKEDKTIKVINKCTKIGNQTKKEAIGTAYTVDKTNSKLKVSFFRPFYGDYWIIDLVQDYSYALIGTPSREYLWILSRTKNIPNKIKDKLLKKAQNLGFDTKNLIWTIQE